MIECTQARKISTVIIAQNESECIANAIQSSLAFADEVVVVDGGSHDATVQIAQDLGCKVYINTWPGYAKQRNFGAEKAVYEWIFFIDADEFVDPELASALLNWKDEPKLEANAFAVNRVGDFLGKWLHSKAEYPVRLYNKNLFQIKDVLVHEAPDIGKERVIRLSGILWHKGFRTIDDLVIRFNKYTSLDAHKSHLAGKKFSLVRLLLKPQAKFLQVYVWQGMYKQGLAGFAVAGLWSYYIFLKEIKLYEIYCEQDSNVKKHQNNL